jgi:hypothetical protein
MAVNQTIGKFIQVASSRDFARDNLFRIMQLSCRNLTLSEDDLVYIKGGKIPGRSTPVAEDVKYMGMTLPYNKSTVQYEGNSSYDIEFYLDAKSELAHKFERASRMVFNDQTTTGDWRFPNMSDVMTVAVLDINLEPIEFVTFYGVSFVKFDPVDFKVAESTGEAISVKATISYLYYKRTGSDVVFAGTNG